MHLDVYHTRTAQQQYAVDEIQAKPKPSTVVIGVFAQGCYNIPRANTPTTGRLQAVNTHAIGRILPRPLRKYGRFFETYTLPVFEISAR